MKKDFITVTPDNGSASGNVTVKADMNPLLKERETTLNFSSMGGLNRSVKAIQSGVPWFCTIGLSNSSIFDSENSFWEPTFLTLPANGISINSKGEVTQDVHLTRQIFPPYSSGNDMMTEQWLTINLVVSKQIISSIKEPFVSIDSKLQNLNQTDIGAYYLYTPTRSNDNDWSIIPNTQEKQIRISLDGGYSFALTYHIMME